MSTVPHVAVVPETPIVANTADAIVYIYRPGKMMGKALEPSVFVDDIELARMDNGPLLRAEAKARKTHCAYDRR